MSLIIFLSSGLFLGWSLGANDAANVFGMAVASKMVKFRTAAFVAAIFVILGSGLSGAGASHTLGELGSVNEIAGSFMVALSAALAVYWMTRLQLPVSTSQAIVGAIVGWNMFSGSLTNYNSLLKIFLTWIISPILAGIISILLYLLVRAILNRAKIHLIRLDSYTRTGLILVGAFGSYSLGANNIANVMGVFVPVSPFKPLDLNFFSISSTEQLFLLGGVAIAVGIFTYSYKVMSTVGSRIVKLTPKSALVVVLASAIVLFLFASQGLQNLLELHGLPLIPLVPVSSSQVIVGAVIGIGIVQGGRGINFRLLGNIASGWVITPIIAGLLSFIALFFLQNVFSQRVYHPVPYIVSREVAEKCISENIDYSMIEKLKAVEYKNAVSFKEALDISGVEMSDKEFQKIIKFAKVQRLKIDIDKLKKEIEDGWISGRQAKVLKLLNGKTYEHTWQLYDALSGMLDEWKMLPIKIQNKEYNEKLRNRLEYLYRTFLIKDPEGR